MKKSTVIWLVIIIIVVILGIWYWSAGQSNSSATNVTTPSSTATTAPAQIVVLNSASTTQLGTFLVAMNGMTLYSYTKDTPGVSTCTGECATVWPPYTIPANEASAQLAGVGGASGGGQVGVITRADGTYQVTYNNAPLYLYSKDVNVGDTNGQGVEGTWFVVAP